MSRLKLMMTPSDLPEGTDQETRQVAVDLFGMLFPGKENPRIDGAHLGIGLLARDPRLATLIVKTTGHIARNLPWVAQRPQLREIAIQTLHLHFASEYAFQARIPNWKAAGLSLELLAQLTLAAQSTAFSDEQRLVVEYTLATTQGKVADELWGRVAAAFGEQGAFEFTVAVSWWSMWAMLINASGIQHDFSADP